jgi:hypothetical protein
MYHAKSGQQLIVASGAEILPTQCTEHWLMTLRDPWISSKAERSKVSMNIEERLPLP